jgi:hypothetical protein
MREALEDLVTGVVIAATFSAFLWLAWAIVQPSSIYVTS